MPPKKNKVLNTDKSLLTEDNLLRHTQNSQEYLNLIFEKNDNKKKNSNVFDKNTDFTKNRIFPTAPYTYNKATNENLEVISNHTEPDTEM